MDPSLSESLVDQGGWVEDGRERKMDNTVTQISGIEIKTNCDQEGKRYIAKRVNACFLDLICHS